LHHDSFISKNPGVVGAFFADNNALLRSNLALPAASRPRFWRLARVSAGITPAGLAKYLILQQEYVGAAGNRS
jgi:hypothetical protein